MNKRFKARRYKKSTKKTYKKKSYARAPALFLGERVQSAKFRLTDKIGAAFTAGSATAPYGFNSTGQVFYNIMLNITGNNDWIDMIAQYEFLQLTGVKVETCNVVNPAILSSTIGAGGGVITSVPPYSICLQFQFIADPVLNWKYVETSLRHQVNTTQTSLASKYWKLPLVQDFNGAAGTLNGVFGPIWMNGGELNTAIASGVGPNLYLALGMPERVVLTANATAAPFIAVADITTTVYFNFARRI